METKRKKRNSKESTMKEGQEDQVEFAAWVNKEERIVTFQHLKGYEKVTFQSNDDKLIYVYHLCEAGYRIF